MDGWIPNTSMHILLALVFISFKCTLHITPVVTYCHLLSAAVLALGPATLEDGHMHPD